MNRLLFALGVACFAAAPLIWPSASFALTSVLAKGLAAMGIMILLRAGLISIGHAAYFAVGAYTVGALSRSGIVGDLILLVVAAGLAAALAGALVGLFIVRYRGIFFAMLNLAISMVFFTLLSKLHGITGGTDGLGVPDPTLFGAAVERATLEWVLLYGGLALAVVCALLAQAYLASPSGMALNAVRTTEVRVEYLGAPVAGVIYQGYVISAALAGLGGALHAVLIGHIAPDLAYWTHSGQLVLIAVLGGIGNAIGPFIGSAFLEAVRHIAIIYFADAWNFIIGAGLLVVIFFVPAGLYGVITLVSKKRARS